MSGVDTKAKKKVTWIFWMEASVIMVIIAYYLITEHTAHLIQYADYILFGGCMVMLALIYFGFMHNDGDKSDPLLEKKS